MFKNDRLRKLTPKSNKLPTCYILPPLRFQTLAESAQPLLPHDTLHSRLSVCLRRLRKKENWVHLVERTVIRRESIFLAGNALVRLGRWSAVFEELFLDVTLRREKLTSELTSQVHRLRYRIWQDLTTMQKGELEAFYEWKNWRKISILLSKRVPGHQEKQE